MTKNENLHNYLEIGLNYKGTVSFEILEHFILWRFQYFYQKQIYKECERTPTLGASFSQLVKMGWKVCPEKE